MEREEWNHREIRLLLDLDDYNAFRRFAFDNKYGDSAYAFRRLLERAGVRAVEGATE
jgi:hypothetical protein